MICPVAAQAPPAFSSKNLLVRSCAPMGCCAVIATSDQRAGEGTPEHRGGCLMWLVISGESASSAQIRPIRHW